MKKILLAFTLLLTIAAQAQKEIVFNEVSPDPGNNKDEYFELFNTTGGTINLDCYTFVAYDFLNGGAWVFNLPNVSIDGFGFVVFSSRKPLRYKCGEKDSATFFDWNTLVNTTQKLTYYDRVGNALVNPVNGITTDLIPIDGGNSAAMAIMLFNSTGQLVNGFFTNNNGNIPTEVTSLSALSYTLTADAGSGCNGNVINLNFAGISAPEAEVLAVQQAVGSSNNYYRDRDGFCGTWQKGQNCNGNPAELSPGTKNSNLPPINSSTAITANATATGCGNSGGGTRSLWNVSVTITDASLLPATIRVYGDNNYSNSLNTGDSLAVFSTTYASGSVNTQQNYNGISLRRGVGAIIQIISFSGCVQIVKVVQTQCIPLPVDFKSFTATRSNSNVLLRWETASEQNNTGFAVERNINGIWEQIAFVPSLAMNGNSDAVLAYSYTDQNNAKGVTQYRLRQVDLNSKSKNSDIRLVRGNGQLGKTIVYPNPANNGKINVVFEDALVTREVSVADMSGRVVRQVKGISNNSITIENLQPGMYMLRIVAVETGEQVVEKIIVNKQ